MVACPFVTQRPIDNDEIRRRSRSDDLAGRSEANEQPTAACEQFFRYENGERGAYDPADNACLSPGKRESIEFRVVAGPACKWRGSSRLAKRAHNVTVGIKNAHRRHWNGWELLLSSCLTQQR